MDDVYVTGLGTVSCLGSGVDRFWRGMTLGHSAPVRPDDPYAHVTRPLLYAAPGGATASEYAIDAATQAVADAGLSDQTRRGLAVVAGTGMGDARAQERWRVNGFPPGGDWRPTFVVAADVGAAVGATGPNTSVSNACAASASALSMAADLVRLGEADVALAVGAEAYSRVALACFDRMGALDPRSCRPFATDRGGTVFGEGAAALVVESATHARNRGVSTVYARLAGAGWSCDAYHPTAPEPGGAQIVRAMTEALAEAGAKVDEVGCVVPHGTGTELNDRVESDAIAGVVGVDVPLYSLKALVGHTGGAAGAMAAVAASLMLHRGMVPGNVAMDVQDPQCTVHLPGEAAPLSGRYTMVNAYAFGGNNISLVLEAVTP